MAWEFGSGNFTDYDFWITEAYFAPDAAYQSGEAILLQLIGVDEEGEDKKEMYSVGKDWISTDGGKTIESSKGGRAKINSNSMFARFAQSAAKLNDGKLANILEKRGDIKESKVWVGLGFHMNEVEQIFGKNIDPQFRNMPVSYLGDDQSKAKGPATVTDISTKKPSPAEIVAAAKAKAGAIPPPESSNGNGGDNALFQSLLTLAKSSEDFNSFVDAAILVDGLTDDDEMLTLATDPTDAGFYVNNH